MIIGLGSDIIDIRRIERVMAKYGDRFLLRIFTPQERAKAERRTETIRAATYAKRYAAKEAASKALGTGFRRGVFWRDLGVVNLSSGQPTLRMAGGAAAPSAGFSPKPADSSAATSATPQPPSAPCKVPASRWTKPANSPADSSPKPKA